MTSFQEPPGNPATAALDWSHGETVIQAFEEAWRLGQEPSIADFLPTDSELRRAVLVELVHADLEFRLKSGEDARVERYLATFPELAADALTMPELLAAEHNWRRRCQNDIEPDEYLHRFPQFYTALMDQIAADDNKTRGGNTTLVSKRDHVWPMLPGYEITEQIGRGGMGVVFRARDAQLDRDVAIKILPRQFASDADRLGRFLREARTASALNHPHICTIHALSEHNGHSFIVMEFIDGQTLRSRIAERAGIDDAVRWLRQVAQALAAAHDAGVVHRDIKPENIMVRADEYVKVLDFGLARRLPTLFDETVDGTPPTATGALLGTAAYMSPEQTRGETTDSASDIFSLGIVAYELLTGRHPFESESCFATLSAIATGTFISPARLNPEIPAPLSELTEAMLRKDKRLRPTAAEVISALSVIRQSDRLAADEDAPSVPVVHRDRELSLLASALSQAEAGRGSVVCVAGEPGIGKTTLVEDFLGRLTPETGRHFIARGNCSERLAGSEAYLPVFDALENLLRADMQGSAARLMKVTAPTWYAQVAAPASGSGADSAQRFLATSQPAMLREFIGLLQEISRLGCVILFLDDMHWADLPTVDLLAHLSRHLGGLHVLVVATFRPTEMLLGPHPFWALKLELQSRGACTEIALPLLLREDVQRYLELRFADHAFPDDFADMIYARTEGSPLFMTALLRDLVEQGAVTQIQQNWQLVGALPDLSSELPQTVRGTIQRKLERLDGTDCGLLAAAAVQGCEFDSLIVADACGSDPLECDDRLEQLARIHGLLRMVRAHDLPDGALCIRYAFVHILYQQTIYHDLLPTRRAAISLALARAIEKRYGKDNAAIAAELACLFEEGRDWLQSARQWWLASTNAGRIFAHGEAIVLARRGIDLLAAVPRSPESLAIELKLQTTLGLQLQVMHGYAEPAAKLAYQRARHLCREVPGGRLFPVLWGLWLYHKVRSELSTAQRLADELIDLARQANDPDLALQAHQALAMTAFCRGEPVIALGHVEQAAALYDPQSHTAHADEFGQDPGVICKAFGAVVLWLLGYPDQAVRESEAAISMSQNLSPNSQAIALYFASMVHQLRREPEKTTSYADRCSAIAEDNGFSLWLAGSAILRGWALAAAGAAADGIALMQKSLLHWEATGAVTYRTYFLGILAERLLLTGDVGQARELLEEAVALADKSEEGLYRPELHRLRGEVKLRERAGSIDLQSAAADFRRAGEIAAGQDAKSLQLRAAASFVELSGSQDGDQLERQQQLRGIYNAFTEGFATPDLQEAKRLLGG